MPTHCQKSEREGQKLKELSSSSLIDGDSRMTVDQSDGRGDGGDSSDNRNMMTVMGTCSDGNMMTVMGT